jgi:hypothetical protein
MGSCCDKEEQYEVEEELFDPTDFLKVGMDGAQGSRDGDKSPMQSVGYCGGESEGEQEMVQVCCLLCCCSLFLVLFIHILVHVCSLLLTMQRLMLMCQPRRLTVNKQNRYSLYSRNQLLSACTPQLLFYSAG